ncbi:MAG TPA: response regulator [Noviherbaspirillum sp.]|nr:response regulator [Noviherbaspirillum sp.]
MDARTRDELDVRQLLDVLIALKKGNFSARMPSDLTGMAGKVADTLNDIIETKQQIIEGLTTVSRVVSREGRLTQRAFIPNVSGGWTTMIDSVNTLIDDLVRPTTEMARVIGAVAKGDLSQTMTLDVDGRPLKGEFLRAASTANTMVERLGSFASEVTRVAREVGTEGKLGGQANVPGVSGTWKDLTDSVNFMAGNLTSQVRNIADVTTAVANGDLSKKITVDVRGEILQLKDTINTMVDQLRSFASEVTRVAREVGTEGKLGGQASVPGAAGTWKDLTENVNQLAANLTTQVRAIAEVATAVTRGDLSRSIQVEARGEVADLKDNINEMIRNLKETTQKNAQQDWLKTNLARFTRLLQGQRDLSAVTTLILSELAPLVSAHHGVFYMMNAQEQEARLRLIASYGYRSSSKVPHAFAPGEGLVGQCALEKQRIWLTNVPRDYIQVSSGLGAAPPTNIVVLPILFEQQVKAVIEIASLDRFTETHLSFLDQLMESIGVVLNTIEANSRTESLLTQSQSLAHELQQTNQELADKARLLSDQNSEVERKNREVEQAKLALEEKAAQLALSSKYKSEFLANMSHELRTPLNSLLILAQQLADNPQGNLSDTQVEFAKTIHGSGSDLLTLINDILDLSKVESGTVTLEVSEYRFETLRAYVERTFRHMAEAKKIAFSIELDNNLPPALRTDITRLQQILKNLLSNAFKFTSHGSVSLHIGMAQSGWTPDHPRLAGADAVLAFAVSDTGVGIVPDKLQLIFEAFQQADGSTARKYGGTGLGLSISRELARLLNGEIRVESTAGAGSTFTLYLPYQHEGFVRHDYPIALNPQLPASTTENDGYPQQDNQTPADDRAIIAPGDQAVLIVENDLQAATSLLQQAREKDFKGIVAQPADSALPLTRDYLPSAILLDIDRPDMDGMLMLDRLKRDPETRHIPVHVLSEQDERKRALRCGAASYLEKPVSPSRLQRELDRIRQFAATGKRRLLVVEDDKVQRNAIVELLESGDVDIEAVGTAHEGLDRLKQAHFDCMVLDLRLPDMSGTKLIDAISRDESLRDLPVVIYTATELGPDEADALQHAAKATIIMKDARSPERLVAETSLFLHRSPGNLPDAQRRMLEHVQHTDSALAGHKVLIVDDDLRNIFALSSLLEREEMTVLFAENGRDGIDILQSDPGIEMVLMDIMMPGMDGYDTMRTIRRIPQFKSLPIITLTAKAMKGDRDKCIAAGASDYITKPVDSAQLLSLMRVWLHR